MERKWAAGINERNMNKRTAEGHIVIIGKLVVAKEMENTVKGGKNDSSRGTYTRTGTEI